MLFVSGEIKSVGRVDSGDTVMDYLPQERERGITISSAAISFKWKDCVINLIDTPGHVDFTIEVERSVRVMDGAVVVVDAVAGVQAQTRTVWRQCQKQNMPAIAFINKMDREGASFERAVSSLRGKINVNAIPIQYPIGAEDKFSGVVDLVMMRKVVYPATASPSAIKAPPMPTVDDLKETDAFFAEAMAARKQMLEMIAEADEAFMDKYLESLDDNSELRPDAQFTPEEILAAIRRACISRSGVPVLCGASLKGKGVEPLLDAINCLLPSPQDRPPVQMTKFATTKQQKREEKMIKPVKESPLVAFAFKIVHDKARGGILLFVRVFAGELRAKDVLYNTSQDAKERANQLFRIQADDLVPVDKIEVGDVCCITGTKETRTGDTIVTDKSPLQSYALVRVHIADAVYSLAVEPEKSSQQDDLEHALAVMCLEDPSLRVELDKESGQTLLRGIGELHLEIVCDKLKRQHGIEVNTGKAYVAFREGLDPDAGVVNKEFKYERQIGTRRLFAVLHAKLSSSITSSSGSDGDSKMDATAESTVTISDAVRKLLSAPQISALEAGFKGAFLRGPNGYPIVGMNVEIENVETDMDSTPGALQACASSLVDSVLRDETYGMLMEPVMTLEIDMPQQYTGDVLSDLSVNRRAVVKEVASSSDGSHNSVLAHVPLATMLGYSTAIRSATKGDCNFSIEYLEHQRVVGGASMISR